MTVKHYLTLAFLILSAVSISAQTQVWEQSIFFSTASAELSAEAQENLRNLSEQLSEMGDYELVIGAHTDSRGSIAYNEDLARRRAEATADFLAGLGISTDQLAMNNYGEQQAGNDQNSEQSLQDNRRVDVSIRGWNWESADQLWDSLQVGQHQRIEIDASGDQLIQGRKGGQFFIPAGTLVDRYGNPVTGPVEIQLKECYTFGDMLTYGLSTTAAEAVLETGGMFELTATADGSPLFVAEGKQIGVMVPTEQVQENMSLFYGNGHNDLSGAEDWENTGQAIQTTPVLQLPPEPKRPKWIAYYDEYYQDFVFKTEEAPRPPKDLELLTAHKPREPRPENIQYYPRGLQKIFMSKEAREAKRQEMIAARMASYEKGLRNYEERLAENERRQLAHERALEAFQEEFITWSEEQMARRSAHQQTPGYLRAKAHYDSIFAMRLQRYETQLSAWQDLRSAQVERFTVAMENTGALNKDAVGQYFFAVNRLGWANIDRFMKGDVQRSPFLAQDLSGADQDAMVFVIIPERSIILRIPPAEAAGAYRIQALPVGEKAHILGVRVNENKVFVASQELVLEEDMTVDLAFTPGRIRDIRAELERWN